MMLQTATLITAGAAIPLLGSTPAMANDRTPPRLQFTVAQKEGLVELSYKLQNLASGPIYVFNRLYKTIDPKRGFMVDPNLCTVEVKSDAIHVAKKIFPVPPNVHVEKLNLPCVTEISTGDEIGEQITLPTPLRPWQPYPSRAQPTRTATALPIAFEVGYFFAVPGTKELAATVKTAIGECPRFDPFPIKSQLIVTAGPTREKFDVLF